MRIVDEVTRIARTHPVVFAFTALLVVGVVYRFWWVILLAAAVAFAVAVIVGRRRHRQREHERLVAEADRSLWIARTHGVQALLNGEATQSADSPGRT